MDYLTSMPKDLRYELNRYIYRYNIDVLIKLCRLFETRASLANCVSLFNDLFHAFSLKTKFYVAGTIKYELNYADIFTDEFVIAFIKKFLEVCMIVYEPNSRKRKSEFLNEYRMHLYRGIRFDIPAEQEYYMLDVYRILQRQ